MDSSTSTPLLDSSDSWVASAFKEVAETTPVTPEVSIICVNWNSLDYLYECISSVNEHECGVSFELVVVDNASTEGDLEGLTQQFPLVKVVKSERNLGFAAANNLGFRHSTGRYILLLNPDTKLIGPALEIMLDRIKALPDAGIVGCKLLNTDLSVSTTSIQRFPTIVNQLLSVEWLRVRFTTCPLWDLGPLFSENDKPVKVDVIPGACMMLKREVFERVGLLSEDYFMYAEDIDLNYKVKKIGMSSYYLGDVQIVHHGGRSSSRQKTSQWSTVMTYRAMLKFYQKSRGRLYGVAYRLAMGASAVIRLVLLTMMLPFGDRQGIRWAIAKWSTVLRWSIGIEHLGISQ